ncbi:MAG: putative Oar protein, partial [Bryobacterales bacterium]|nr:putative Oar protein [Bryobacterales bacterium]
MRCAFAASLALLLLGARISLAQVDAGAIVGAAKDTSGALVPGAKVTLTNEDTGLVTTTPTGASSEYTFAPIKIGHYSIAAEIKGFQRVEHTHVTVEVQQRVLVDFVLPPGQMTQTVLVTAEPPALQTQDASVGQV